MLRPTSIRRRRPGAAPRDRPQKSPSPPPPPPPPPLPRDTIAPVARSNRSLAALSSRWIFDALPPPACSQYAGVMSRSWHVASRRSDSACNASDLPRHAGSVSTWRWRSPARRVIPRSGPRLSAVSSLGAMTLRRLRPDSSGSVATSRGRRPVSSCSCSTRSSWGGEDCRGAGVRVAGCGRVMMGGGKAGGFVVG
ncbi:MAG: hypothetical protein J3K34DRAFT_138421 [Monoraphidium minutum]|nr:MAG: hypothetical protein J3K34DRAFT_138421 [Monoraphidium minutum]